MLKRFLKNERGLTLIELLAVVVILGIIAAIAVPSIGGIIDNTKKDAHVANAQQMISAAKMAVAGDKSLLPTANTNTGDKITLGYLQTEGFLDAIDDPDGTTNGYDTVNSKVVISTTDGKVFTYSVKLINSTRGVQTETDKKPVAETDLSRDQVR